MKEFFQIVAAVFKFARALYSEIRKKQQEQELRDVKEAIKSADLDSLRDSILGPK